MNPTNAEIAGYLNAAADHLTSGKWVQGLMAADHAGKPAMSKSQHASCWCAAGAIHHVVPSWEEGMTVVFALTDFMAPGEWPRPFGSTHHRAPLTQFNDAEGRTKAEVVDLLRRGAAHFAAIK